MAQMARKTLIIVVAALSAVACGDDDGDGTADAAAAAADAPAAADAAPIDATDLTPLLIGVWQEPPPTAYLRFSADGTTAVAFTIAELDTAPFGAGSWVLDGARLTFTNTSGVCSDNPVLQVGVYDIEVTSAELTFTKVDDPCAERAVIDGQTWTRVP